eukprot:CAMPEP_0184340432 /NCGR_PEP_ID=MMETSP1089-20130417/9114_1 /TAXON_ID=38269 ORGANISM="Gloeochaete wittrockiana, Strain SAG46.84" /NCGR_SAMPLE_ID=MMETSP1089 /ASSEMBLY_ACC=CAM_ASM_000445 /LENGTH=40 /DNA_ID= /DNA_START= /DNA_END= /DNA_ORIENTATION=
MKFASDFWRGRWLAAALPNVSYCLLLEDMSRTKPMHPPTH